jgi:hypothetical protein
MTRTIFWSYLCNLKTKSVTKFRKGGKIDFNFTNFSGHDHSKPTFSLIFKGQTFFKKPTASNPVLTIEVIVFAVFGTRSRLSYPQN